MSENSETPEEKLTKAHFRKKVWENLEKNNLVNFPRPCYYRIPNFKGSEEAASKLQEIDIFKTSRNIYVNPDKAQEPARLLVLENNNNLYVPVPKLEKGLLKHVVMSENANKDDFRKAVNRRGIENGKDVNVDDDLTIDLVILGSVAVSKEGYRIGKGKGYADLEYAILSQMKAVNPDIFVITTVHDSQVFDTLPVELFKSHDVPVDIILTPTEIIYVDKRLPKPTEIIWSILSQRRIDIMPVLKLLKDIDEKAGKDVTLKEIDSDVENREPKRRFRYRQTRQKKLEKESKSSENQDEDKEANKENQKRHRKFFHRKNQTKTDQNTEKTNNPEQEMKTQRRQKRTKKQTDFSVVVRNMERSLRVRDMKQALAGVQVKPKVITWRGHKGYCCLHFASNELDTHNTVLGMLQNLNIASQPSKQITIEIMKPISRIETTDITAV